MSFFDDFFNDVKCTALKVSPIFWAAVGHVYTAKAAGLKNYDQCMNVPLPDVPLASDIRECACKYVFKQAASGPVVLFSNDNFQGNSQAYDVGFHLGANGELDVVGNDQTTSVIVSPGYYCVLYENADGGGLTLRLNTGLYPGLGNYPFKDGKSWNDQVSSVLVARA